MNELSASQAAELNHHSMHMERAESVRISSKTASAAAYVADARAMAIELEDEEALSLGNVERARRYIAYHFGIAQTALDALRRRHPKTVAANVYDGLCRALQAVATTQIKTLHHRITTAAHKQLRAHHDHIRAGLTLVQRAREHFARPTSR